MLGNPIALDSVHGHLGTIVSLYESSVFWAVGRRNYVHIVPVSSKPGGKALSESSGTIDVGRERVAANNNSQRLVGRRIRTRGQERCLF